MSGHSKWAQIKRQKGVADLRRGQTFTKIANTITIAVRDGGGISDPNQNFRLRLAIEKAREVNMPKENVSRAIDRALGKGEKDKEVTQVNYEGIGPQGGAIIVEAVTDNKQRSQNEIRNIMEKYGITMVAPGSTAYLFAKRGVITIKRNGKSIDDLFTIAEEAGGQDIEEAGDDLLIYTQPHDLAKVRQRLQESITVADTKLSLIPTINVVLKETDAARMLLALRLLENLDDVQEVYTNIIFPDTD
ncbi:MAG: YebC/PmpR family DNA-binding transcriptional regulator [Candidatus Levybacteria bacterium]|nr:YebC/PmpR family DNA-binding transcriptional regulator [Candidatus Levybacteria bacterium]